MSRKRNKKRKGQQIARFEEGEIFFLINREYPNKAQEVKNKFSGLKYYGISPERTMAAILKLAEGDFDKLKGLIKKANVDPRDVIGYAEYPRSMKKGFVGMDNLTEDEQEEIYVNDREEYREWQNKNK